MKSNQKNLQPNGLRIFVVGMLSLLAATANAGSGIFSTPSVWHAARSVPAGTPGVTYNFEGIVALSNCSGSLVKFTSSVDSDRAMVLTNGHCLEGGMPKPGVVHVNKPVSRTMSLLHPTTARPVGSIHAEKILYSTMTGTDMTLYGLRETYDEIRTQFSIRPLVLSEHYGRVSGGIDVISGYWKRGYSCRIDGFVHTLKEDAWTMNESIRYSRPGCETIGGTSGSPVISTDTKEVIGVNNTGNEDGQKCTMNNPCEVDEQGAVTFEKGLSYGQQTSWVYSCLTAARTIDVTLAGCRLAKP